MLTLKLKISKFELYILFVIHKYYILNQNEFITHPLYILKIRK